MATTLINNNQEINNNMYYKTNSQSSNKSNRCKTIFYWTAIVVLFALFIGFLVAFIVTKNGKPCSFIFIM